MLRKALYKNPAESDSKKLKTAAAGNTDETTSTYFVFENVPEFVECFANKFLQIQLHLNAELKLLSFKEPVKYIYNPVEYAFKPNENYIRKFCGGPKKLIFVGMNPGPFGMCQTGVPFGDVNWVSNWLKVDGVVTKPPVECPERPILGFNNTRKEQSGHRFWGFFADLCQTPENFFKYSFVYNYCPLAFLNHKGVNITPADMKHAELEGVCNKYYLEILKLLEPEIIIAVGTYIEKQTNKLISKNNTDQTNNIKVLRIAHPSPRAINNNNWPEKAKHFLETNNLISFFKEV